MLLECCSGGEGGVAMGMYLGFGPGDGVEAGV